MYWKENSSLPLVKSESVDPWKNLVVKKSMHLLSSQQVFSALVEEASKLASKTTNFLMCYRGVFQKCCILGVEKDVRMGVL